MSTQDKVRFEFSLITIMLSVEQLQSEERIIEGRTAVPKKKKERGKRVTIIVLILAQSLILWLSLLYWAQSLTLVSVYLTY